MAHSPGPGDGGNHGQEPAGRVSSPGAHPRGPSCEPAWATRVSCCRASPTRHSCGWTDHAWSGPTGRCGATATVAHRAPSGREPARAPGAHAAARGLYVWPREAPFGPERTRLCCPRKTTLPASAKSHPPPRWQPATAGSGPRCDLRAAAPCRAVSLVSCRRGAVGHPPRWQGATVEDGPCHDGRRRGPRGRVGL